MITTQQKRHFETFGYILIKQMFSKKEIAKITLETDTIFATERSGKPIDDSGQHCVQFVENNDILTGIVTDDRIYQSVGTLLDPGFIWAGSEGNVTTNSEHRWHPDRPGRQGRTDNIEELSYTRLKINLYLDSVTVNNGCLRVIPGSHRMPLHGDIEPEVRHQTAANVRPFGIPGSEMPSVALESEPGDAIFFNQSIWHAIFNGWAGRRYVALKFASQPKTGEHLSSLKYYGGTTIFSPHCSWLNSKNERIRGMVESLPGMTKRDIPDFMPFRNEDLS